MKTKQLFFGVIVLALVATAGYMRHSAGTLKQVPALTLRTLDGAQLDLAAQRGKPLLVTFWATTCSTCVEEIPHLVELHKSFGPRGVQILAIAMSYDPPNQVVALRDARKLPYAIALDIDGAAARAFGEVAVTPTSFLIGPDGRVVQQIVGLLDMAEIQTQLESLLGS